jgi:two-component system cell cycle sensor histidine kinase/response regulator CckA
MIAGEAPVAQQAVRGSQEMFRAIVDTIPVMVMVYDGSGNAHLLNREFTRILGWTLEDARKVDLMAECYPDPAERREVWKFMASAAPGWRDFRVRARDGRVFASAWANVHLPDGSLIGIGIDLSERQRVEEEVAEYRARHEKAMEQKLSTLREAEARLRGLLETLSDRVWEVDADGVYTYVSPGTGRLLGYEPGEVVGKTLFDLMPAAEAQRVREIFEASARDGRPFPRVEIVNLHKDGHAVVFETSGTPFFGANGALLGYRGVDRDVSERKMAEHARQDSEERFRTLADQMSLAVYETDDEGRFAYMNRHGLDLFGYPGDAVGGGLTFFDLVAPPDRERAREDFPKRAAEDPTKAEEYLWLRKDGTTFPGVACLALFRRNGRDAAIGGMLMDLSDLRRAERELMGSQKYEMVGRIVGGIAHHLNNLMTVVAGYGTLIVDRMDARDPWRRQVEEMRCAGERAAALTAQLLAYSRRQLLRPERVDLARFLAGVEADIRREAGPGADVSILADPGAGAVRVDPEALRNAVLRMVENSREAMPEGGAISVLARRADLSREDGPPVPAGDYAMIAVTDTGIGMDEGTRSQVFEPFFTTKEPGKGAGLSLPSVYGFVKQSKGYIFADSVPGEGTTISIYFPQAEGGARDSAAAESQPEAR